MQENSHTQGDAHAHKDPPVHDVRTIRAILNGVQHIVTGAEDPVQGGEMWRLPSLAFPSGYTFRGFSSIGELEYGSHHWLC